MKNEELGIENEEVRMKNEEVPGAWCLVLRNQHFRRKTKHLVKSFLRS